MKKPPLTNSPCPCGGISYDACCAPYHHGTPAPTAEALMRSRYSAYAMHLEPYLLATWHLDTRPANLDLKDDKARWIGLEIRRHFQDTPDTATVEFVARYKTNGRAQRLHEISRFVREQGQWFYLDGTFQE
jgi:SEC-C motif-containing protein